MKKTTTNLTKFTLTLGIGLSFSLISCLGQGVLAQSNNSTDQAPSAPSSEENPFTGGGSFNPFDLIHNANFSNGRSSQEFYQDTNQNLNQATNDFKRLQRERLQNQSKSEQSNPTVTPDSPETDQP